MLNENRLMPRGHHVEHSTRAAAGAVRNAQTGSTRARRAQQAATWKLSQARARTVMHSCLLLPRSCGQVQSTKQTKPERKGGVSTRWAHR